MKILIVLSDEEADKTVEDEDENIIKINLYLIQRIKDILEEHNVKWINIDTIY